MKITRKINNLLSIFLISTLFIALVIVVIFGTKKEKREQLQLKETNLINYKITKEENEKVLEKQNVKVLEEEKAVIKQNSIIKEKIKFIEKCQNGSARYAILGDSITDAGNVTKQITGGASIPSKGYASVLRDKLILKYGTGITFDNRGIAGQTVDQSVSRVATQIIPNNYDLVVIQLGTNDWNSGTTLKKFETDYRQLVDLLISKTRAEIVCTSMGWVNNIKGIANISSETEYNKIIQKISVEHKLKYIDTYTAMKNSGKGWSAITLTSDPVHPNDAGHLIWANEIFKNLTKVN